MTLAVEHLARGVGKKCDTTDALGGCASPNTITWYWESPGMQSAADVKKACRGDSEFRKP